MNKCLLFCFLFFLLSTFGFAQTTAAPDINCGAQEAKLIIEKMYSCPQGTPDLDELFKKEKLRLALNYVCYLCLHKEVAPELKKEKKQICERMYVEAIEKSSDIDLVMRTSRCQLITDNVEKMKTARSETFAGCEFGSSKVLKMGYAQFKQFLCVGHVFCPGRPERTPFMQEAHCMIEPKYAGEDDNSKHVDNLLCPSVEMCAFDLSSIREVDEVDKSWSSGPLHDQYADFIQTFRPSYPESK